MSWNARVSVLVLVILTSLPVSGTVCAYFCHPPPQRTDRAAAHHGDAACAHSSDTGADLQIRGVAGHDCRSHSLSAQSPATPERVSSSVSSTSIPAAVDQASGSRTITRRSPPGRDAAGGTPPLTATRVVLRI